MKIVKAIEILHLAGHRKSLKFTQDFFDAVKLGEEALKAWQEQRKDTEYHHIHLLPGETPED